MDQISTNVQLPKMDIGEWMVFRDMGAYTIPVACAFNGFPVPQVNAYITADLWLIFTLLHSRNLKTI